MGPSDPLAVASTPTRATPGAWQVILDWPLREKALEVVRIIGEDLASLPVLDPSLGSGNAGLAVCFAYLAEGLSEPAYEAMARRRLEQAISMAETEAMLPWLHSGLAGLGWAASHLSARLPGLNVEGTLTDIDEALCDYLQGPVWRDDYHLTDGLVGLGVYALERLRVARRQRWDDVSSATHCLERVVDHLTATAEHKTDGATWWRGPERLSLHALKKMPDGAYDLGLGEGVPGVIAFLARVCDAGVAVERTRPLLEEATRWVLAQEAPHGPPEGFPYCIRPNRPQRNWTRSSWCYGDPGVAAAQLTSYWISRLLL